MIYGGTLAVALAVIGTVKMYNFQPVVMVNEPQIPIQTVHLNLVAPLFGTNIQFNTKASP